MDKITLSYSSSNLKIKKGKVYSFRIKNRKEKEQGIIIEEGEDWIFLKHLFTDYMVDGYILLNKKYIESVSRSKKEVFTENVLKANNKLNIIYNISPPLSTFSLIKWLQKNKTVFQISNWDESVCWIGRIDRTTTKSIFLTPLNAKGEWEGPKYYTFRKETLRILSFDSDYINSLLEYSKIYDR